MTSAQERHPLPLRSTPLRGHARLAAAVRHDRPRHYRWEGATPPPRAAAPLGLRRADAPARRGDRVILRCRVEPLTRV